MGFWGYFLIFLAISIGYGIFKNIRKSYKDPNVILATKLNMNMFEYNDSKELFEERAKLYKEYGSEWPPTIKIRMPKYPNAFRKYETYMQYLKDKKEWDEFDELTKNVMSFNNPYEKEEYAWIRELGL